MVKPKLLDRRLLHRGPEIEITIDQVRLPNGAEVTLEQLKHPGAAAVVPLISDDEVLLLKQYRWAASEWLYEIPAGKLRAGEAPEACAARELEEETGYRAGRLVPLGWIWTTPGFANEKIHLFSAHDLEPAEQALEEDEVLDVLRLPLTQIRTMIADGTLRDAKSLCALFKVMH